MHGILNAIKKIHKKKEEAFPPIIQGSIDFIKDYLTEITEEDGTKRMVWNTNWGDATEEQKNVLIISLNDAMDRLNNMSPEELTNIIACSKDINDNIISRILQGALQVLISINTIWKPEKDLKINTMGLINKVINMNSNINTYVDKRENDINGMILNTYRAMEDLYEVNKNKKGKKNKKRKNGDEEDNSLLQVYYGRENDLLKAPGVIMQAIRKAVIGIVIANIKTTDPNLKEYFSFDIDIFGKNNSPLKTTSAYIKGRTDDIAITEDQLNDIIYYSIKNCEVDNNDPKAFASNLLRSYKEPYTGYQSNERIVQEGGHERVVIEINNLPSTDMSGIIYYSSLFIKSIDNNDFIEALKALAYINALDDNYHKAGQEGCLTAAFLHLLNNKINENFPQYQYEDIIAMKECINKIKKEIEGNEQLPAEEMPLYVRAQVNKIHKEAVQYYETWYSQYICMYNLKRSFIAPTCTGLVCIGIGIGLCLFITVDSIKAAILTDKQSILYDMFCYINDTCVKTSVESAVATAVGVTLLSTIAVIGLSIAGECLIRYLITHKTIEDSFLVEEKKTVSI